jgi:hypothetical protein
MPPTVEEAVREGWVREASVAARGALRNGFRFEQYDFPSRVGFLCVECRPEPGESTARDDEVGLFTALECGARSGTFGTVEPITA